VSSTTGCIFVGGNDGVHGVPANLVIQNNICINTGISVTPGGYTGTLTMSHNVNMSATEANTYGFTIANKFSPTAADPNTVNQGVNLSSLCVSVPAICSDASGTPWFGGTAKVRGTLVDVGAFEFGGGSTVTRPNPPTGVSAVVQ
jgi:hypothetical protein